MYGAPPRPSFNQGPPGYPPQQTMGGMGGMGGNVPNAHQAAPGQPLQAPVQGSYYSYSRGGGLQKHDANGATAYMPPSVYCVPMSHPPVPAHAAPAARGAISSFFNHPAPAPAAPSSLNFSVSITRPPRPNIGQSPSVFPAPPRADQANGSNPLTTAADPKPATPQEQARPAAEEKKDEKKKDGKKKKEERATKLVYSDNNVSPEEKMARLPKYYYVRPDDGRDPFGNVPGQGKA